MTIFDATNYADEARLSLVKSGNNMPRVAEKAEAWARSNKRTQNGIAWCWKFRGYAARGADGMWRDLQGKVLREIGFAP